VSVSSRWAADKRVGRRTLVVAVVILSAWLTSSLALVPTFAAIHKPHFVLEEVPSLYNSTATTYFYFFRLSIMSFYELK